MGNVGRAELGPQTIMIEMECAKEIHQEIKVYTWELKKANWNLYKEEVKKRVNKVNGKITERVKKMIEIMLDAA